MMNLWSLLSPRRKMRCYALLDSDGRCRALRESTVLPSQPGWVQVRELRTCWLGQPLPVSEIILSRQQFSRPRTLVTA
ncbi:hypothetical protein [Aquipseudomonas guryensis]|jgi:hypothetical protein|uniref:Uncharacterized protein n=1 Tax=Aquipseudomonas guryensis TaxID=2759165 RepID=A0A7W4DCP9_9GAMM|nr:hypothetical protein [Pseudomonas guryensis]MBB1520189.1 hypothetical protein [Pseudomonas guryensis]